MAGRALVIGGGGQTGRAVVTALLEAGFDVTATTRDPGLAADPPAGGRWVEADRSRPGELESALGEGADVAADVVAMRPADADQLIGLADRIGSAVVVSTLAVYTGGFRAAGGRPWPVPLPESHPRLPPGEDAYANRKVALEDRCLAAPFPVTVVRPGAIHGPGGRHLREWYFLKRALDRRPRIVLPYLGRSIFQPTAAANLGRLVAAAAGRPGSRALNVGDPDPPDVAAIAELVGARVGHRFEAVLVDGPPPATDVGDHPWCVPDPLVVDNAAAETSLGFRPDPYEDHLAAACADALERTRGRDWRDVFPVLAGYPGDLFDYAAEDAFLEDMSGS